MSYWPNLEAARVSEYSKGVDAKATIGEAMQVAQKAMIPTFIAARFALIVAGVSFLVSALALAVAFAR